MNPFPVKPGRDFLFHAIKPNLGLSSPLAPELKLQRKR